MSGILLIADHASNHVPADIDLDIDPALLDQHMAIDIGVEPLGRLLCRRLGMDGIFGPVSRLVVDLNREEHAQGLIPTESDGFAIAGNELLDAEGRRARIERFWRPYHRGIADRIAADRPRLIVSLHSFTPRLSARPGEARPWQVGVLYNRDDRAASLGIAALRAAGIVTGDNEPYSGKVLNATMNMHAEANAIPYLGLEVRQDLIGDEAGVAAWAERLAPVIAIVAERLGDPAAA
ncbi:MULTISPECIES: N-formylglutamate amidohydrolase [unclassified Sphingomonas]|uniref:N-formylglutamate amidohydrolase n=1 Tax=unclassified Sphingomonas TaxID=196159 RepID=UPI0006F7EAB9|nr:MULTISPECIES: N-formylglutamate amidohydrolase [unclassified Sphingomonas]KQX19249.1 N-formylglutamate amidohydrolase [Sphingomonas sp. Root1294]KQY65451.1 N-formylglutamate amidohydrolase [Sphingomonas sp. Root50]KRB95251.1 N-formylglutamate amidohydrolase [Sphingomonas sp. Root720]